MGLEINVQVLETTARKKSYAKHSSGYANACASSSIILRIARTCRARRPLELAKTMSCFNVHVVTDYGLRPWLSSWEKFIP